MNKNMHCPMCGGMLKKARVKEEYLGHMLGEFDGKVCTKCGETILSAENASKAFNKAKELGLVGLSEKSRAAKSGNPLMARIKKKLADYLNMAEGKEVIISPQGKNKLVIELAG